VNSSKVFLWKILGELGMTIIKEGMAGKGRRRAASAGPGPALAARRRLLGGNLRWQALPLALTD